MKYKFDVKETVFLGIIILGEGLRIDPKKIEAIVKQAIPTNLTKTQTFIGFANFYRRVIREFSRLVKPLVYLIEKDISFVQSAAYQAIF